MRIFSSHTNRCLYYRRGNKQIFGYQYHFLAYHAIPLSLLCLALLTIAMMCTGCDSPSSSKSSASYSQSYQLPNDVANLTPVNQPIKTTGCGNVPHVPLGASVSLTLPAHPAQSEGHTTRSYILHLPSSYQKSQPYALVLAFHGFGSTAMSMDVGSGWTALAEQQHFIVAYPQGLPSGDNGPALWASVGPIDYGIDDLLFVSDLITSLQQRLCIDATRIYATGFSNGGGMTGFLACRLSGRIAAFVPMSGNFYDLPGGCHPARPVSLLDFHGLQDKTLPYNGIPASENASWPLPAIPQWLRGWAARDGCTQGPIIFLQQGGVTGEQWGGCKGNASLVHYTFQGGHSFPPPIQGQSAVMVAWKFFEAHTFNA